MDLDEFRGRKKTEFVPPNEEKELSPKEKYEQIQKSKNHEETLSNDIEKLNNFTAVKKTSSNENKVVTKLLDKNFSPMIIRKYTVEGWPLFCSIICDLSLSDLDEVVIKSMDDHKNLLINDIQSIRNFTGNLSQDIVNHYNNIKKGSVESVGIIYFYDKCCCSSLWGDVMHHAACRQELYFLLNIFPHV